MDSRFAELWAEHVGDLELLFQRLPQEQVVTLMHTEHFSEEVERLPPESLSEASTKLFWIDQINTAEAWVGIFVRRAWDLSDTSRTLLMEEKYLPAAPVVRALLELSVTGLVTSGRVAKVMREAMAARSIAEMPWSNSVEKDLMLAIWGTRIPELYKEPDTEHLYQKTGVGKWINEMSKRPGATSLAKEYDFLSDLCHPNLGGNRPFYRVDERDNVCLVSSSYDEEWRRIASHSLELCLSWSAKGVLNVHAQLTQVAEEFRARLTTSSLH